MAKQAPKKDLTKKASQNKASLAAAKSPAKLPKGAPKLMKTAATHAPLKKMAPKNAQLASKALGKASTKAKAPMAMAAKAGKGASKNKKESSKLSTLKNMILGKKKTPKEAPAKKTSPKDHGKGHAKSHTKDKVHAKPAKAEKVTKASAKTSAPVSAPAKGKGKAEVASEKATAGKGTPAPVAASPLLTKVKKVKAAGSSRYSDAEHCREVACEGLATTGGYCRMHYIKNWKKIKRKEVILKEGKLNQYIEELLAKYPDKYIEAIRQDLANDKDFAKVIYDLDLDESVDDFSEDGDSGDAIIDNIKREFEDDGDF